MMNEVELVRRKLDVGYVSMSNFVVAEVALRCST